MLLSLHPVQHELSYPDSKVHGPTWGPTGPRWVPCWPHELCYLGMWFNGSVRQGRRNVALKHAVAEKIIFLAHHTVTVLGKKNATNHIQTTKLLAITPEGGTPINGDSDVDDDDDLNLKICYKLSRTQDSGLRQDSGMIYST